MWKGRFQTDTAELLKKYSESISFDWRLYAHDIAGSVAHSKALHDAGLLTADEQKKIRTACCKFAAKSNAASFRSSATSRTST